MSQWAIELFEQDHPVSQAEVKRHHQNKIAAMFDKICDERKLTKALLSIQPLHAIKEWIEVEIGPGVLIEKIPPWLEEYKNG